ncbi:MAG: tetratricopeptide (TPR) repeat protein [Planctomycetota bacterium]|jgi:tetratricopeptide (TPR) repeat protein
MKKISLCMIVRNEESSLARCLASVQSIVDEVCIVDTGSTDRTIAIANEFGARVLERAWNHDFSAARNASLAMASGDWVLVLDADEELSNPQFARAKLERFMASDTPRLGRVLIENQANDGECSSISITRFFPKSQAFTYCGIIHEQVSCSETQVEHKSTGLCILHHGYALAEPEREIKLQRNTELLRRALSSDPEDGYLWFQLGRTLALADDNAGALDALEQGLARCPDDAPWGVALLETGAYALRALGRSGQALKLLSNVEVEFSQRADTCFLIALLSMDCGQLERAERGFLHCLDLGGNKAHYTETEAAAAAATCAPAFNLGVMKEVLGDKRAAESWFRKALEFRPGHGPSTQALLRIGA